MIFAIAAKAFRDIRAATLVAGVIGAALAASSVFLFESYASAVEGLEDLAIYQGITGSSTLITEPAGFLAAVYFSWVPLLLVVIGVLGGTGALSAQEEDGTLDFILAQPVARWQVLTGTALGLAAAVSLAAGLAIPAFAISIPLADLDLSLWRASAAVLITIPLVLLYLALGLLFAAVMPSRGTAVTSTVGLAIGGYFLQIMGGLSADLEPLQKASPFRWAEAGRTMADGLSWGPLVAMSGAVILVTVVATWRFQRREIGAHRPLSLPSMPWAQSGQDDEDEDEAATGQNRDRRPVIAARFPVAQQAARGMRGGAMGIGLTAFLMALMLGYYYPQVVAELHDLGDLEWMADLAGPAGGYTTPAGFFTVEFFSWIPLLYLAIGVAAATGAVGNEENRGTMDLVLSQPLSRRRFILEKAGGITLALTLSMVLCIPGFAVAIPLGDLDIGLLTVCKAILMMGMLVFMHSSIALWLATKLPTRSAAVIVTSSVIAAGYLLQLVGSLVPALEQIRKASPFYWADPAEAMVNGIAPAFFAALCSLTAIFAYLAVVSFESREISAGGGGGVPPWRRLWDSVRSRPSQTSHSGHSTGTSDA